MSEALRNFLFLKDPLGKGYGITVTQRELEALFGAHKVAEEPYCPRCDCPVCEP